MSNSPRTCSRRSSRRPASASASSEQHQFAAIPVLDANGQSTALGMAQSEAIWEHLHSAGYIDAHGKVQDPLRQALKEATLRAARALPGPACSDQADVIAQGRRQAGDQECRRTEAGADAAGRAAQPRVQSAVGPHEAQDDLSRCSSTTRSSSTSAREPLQRHAARHHRRDCSVAQGRHRHRARSGVSSEQTATAAQTVVHRGNRHRTAGPAHRPPGQAPSSRAAASVRVLNGSGRLADFVRNPQQFIELAAEAINR
jgi:type III restriction enzyme